jgi:putative glutamine amidotransferase
MPPPNYHARMRPVIGITTRPKQVQTSGGDLYADTLQHTYRDAVLASGGLPLLLAPVPAELVDAVLDRIDGLVLTGGGDIHPRFYGSEIIDEMYDIHESRDIFEMEVTRRAAARALPTLAICRGLQVVNVAFGGSLVEDIPAEFGTHHATLGEGAYERHQPVGLDASCNLAALFGDTQLKVNSIHHQAVRDVAPGFRTVAWADDGVVEAIEHEGGWPLLAVQWHPEYLHAGGDSDAHILFDELVRLAIG